MWKDLTLIYGNIFLEIATSRHFSRLVTMNVGTVYTIRYSPKGRRTRGSRFNLEKY